MNRKIIKSIISKKVKELIDSITEPEIKKIIKEKAIVTGGCIVSLLLKEDINDFDLYLKDKNAVLEVAKYYVNKFNEGRSKKATVQEKDDRIKIYIQSDGVAKEEERKKGLIDIDTIFDDSIETNITPDTDIKEELTDSENNLPKYRPVFLTSNAITLSDQIQLVIRFYGEPDKIHANYDFVHCTNYYDVKTGELNLKPKALEAILFKRLVYVGSKYPLCSIIRTRKFIKRGWSISAGEYLKMAMQLNSLVLTEISVLEEQLVGVDTAYFQSLIEGLKSKLEGDPNWKIDNDYVAKIIDKIF